MHKRSIVIFFSLVLLLGLGVVSTAAGEANKETRVTFNERVEVPGKILAPGTYTFRLFDTPATQNVVQILDQDGTNLITTVLAVRDRREQVPGQAIVKFDERAANLPAAVETWYYPGEKLGWRFVYPEHRALELAKWNHRNVAAYPPEAAVETDLERLRSTKVHEVTPEQGQVDFEASAQTTPQPKKKPDRL